MKEGDLPEEVAGDEFVQGGCDEEMGEVEALSRIQKGWRYHRDLPDVMGRWV